MNSSNEGTHNADSSYKDEDIDKGSLLKLGRDILLCLYSPPS